MRTLLRVTAATATAVTAATAMLMPSAMAAKAKPVTLAQLMSAEVPALCGHPAGRLVNGRLPGVTVGRVVLAATPQHHGSSTLAVGDLNSDGVRDAAAVVVCSASSPARSASIQLYTSGGAWLGGFDLAHYTHRPTDVVAKVVIAHRKVAVKWTANQKGDAACCPTLDYSVDLTLKGKAVLPSHPHTYTDGFFANKLAGYIRAGNPKAALKLATPQVVAQMVTVHKAGYLAGLYNGLGSPTRDPRWGMVGYNLGVRATGVPAWLNTKDRYAIGQFGLSTHVSVIRLQHLGWGKWRADSFAQTTAA